MKENKHLFVNVEDALNFIEAHEEKNDLYLYRLTADGGIEKRKGVSLFWQPFLRRIGFSGKRKIINQILRTAIANLRRDFNDVKNEKVQQSIEKLESLIKDTNYLFYKYTEETQDALITELRHFRTALFEDAEFRLKRLQLIKTSISRKMEKLRLVDRSWLVTDALDFLVEIDDELEMYDREKEYLEKGHRVYSSIIEKSQAIDIEMEEVKEKYAVRLPNALNWAITLALLEMSENGIPEFSDIGTEPEFKVGDVYVRRAEKNYQQLRKLYIKHHNKLRKDLRGSFDNNFSEYEARLYFAKQLLYGV